MKWFGAWLMTGFIWKGLYCVWFVLNSDVFQKNDNSKCSFLFNPNKRAEEVEVLFSAVGSACSPPFRLHTDPATPTKKLRQPERRSPGPKNKQTKSLNPLFWVSKLHVQVLHHAISRSWLNVTVFIKRYFPVFLTKSSHSVHYRVVKVPQQWPKPVGFLMMASIFMARGSRKW